MSLSSFLTDLDAARVRFRQLLAGKNITVGNGATIINCLDLLADYWDTSAPVVTPGSLDLCMYYEGSKYLLGSGVNADFLDVGYYNSFYSATYVIVSGVLGRFINGVFTALQIENNTGWSKVGGNSYQFYAIRNGRLYAVYPSSVVQVGADSGWTDISKYYAASEYYAGIRNGQLYIIQGTAALPISESTGWRFLIGSPSAVADADGKLYQVTETGPVLKSELQGWTHIAGFVTGPYTFGICAGKLYLYTGGTFTQVGISDQWNCVSSNNHSPLAICNGQLYAIIGGSSLRLLDSSTGYTDCCGFYDPTCDFATGFAVRNNRLIEVRRNSSTGTDFEEISTRTISQIFSNISYTNAVFFLEASAESDNRPATTKLTLTAPDDLGLYATGNSGNASSHYWSDDDVLTVKVLRGSTVLTTSCTGYNGVEFETNSLSHLCAGNRVMVDVGNKPEGLAETELTIQWLRGSTVVKTETRTFDWKHTPQYFTRPAGEGNYSLKIGGSAVSAEVYYGGEWIDFPSGVLTAQYAGCSVRTKTETALDAIACWSNEGADGDNFWYLT